MTTHTNQLTVSLSKAGNIGTLDRVEIVHQNFLKRVAAGDLPKSDGPSLDILSQIAIAAFRAGVTSRALDRHSREMQRTGHGYYTIGSSGHENMAAVALAMRPSDPAFLHYRDAAFQIARAGQVTGQTPSWDMLLSFTASSEDPISGGRHKVLGSKALAIPPQTSTIASHLPKALGAAWSIAASRRRPPENRQYPGDAISICSFGDASANHATAQTAFNAAAWTSFQNSPLPLLFICEDNGIGISTRSPKGWVKASFESRPGLKYFEGDGLNLFDTFRAATDAANYVRRNRKPAFLHLKMVRLYGHAGADVATSYLPLDHVEAEEANDPLLHSVRLLDDVGALPRETALAIYRSENDRIARQVKHVVARPRLQTANEVMDSLIPPPRECNASNGPDPTQRKDIFGRDFRFLTDPQPMSRLINWALTDLMVEFPEITVMGEDIGRKGGVYGVTQKLIDRFGPDRMVDTLLDETTILGMAVGMAQNGFLPMPEIQFLAYYHNAEDQIRGEAATLPFFSNGQFSNPMVLRIAGLGYQKGFGGHFHNDNSIAVLRDVPGIIVACPSHGADAAKMLRECVRLAREEQRVVVFLEPIALYSMRDLHNGNDGGWLHHYPDPTERIEFGCVGVTGEGNDLAIISFANGHYLSRQAMRALHDEGIEARVIDLRWLSPLPYESLVQALDDAKRVLIVDETRRTGGIAAELAANLADLVSAPIQRLAAEDSFIATGPAYAATMPSRESILRAARKAMQ